MPQAAVRESAQRPEPFPPEEHDNRPTRPRTGTPVSIRSDSCSRANASQRERWFSDRHRPSEPSVSGNKADSERFCLGIWSASISVRIVPQASVVVRRTAGLSARGAIVYTDSNKRKKKQQKLCFTLSEHSHKAAYLIKCLCAFLSAHHLCLSPQTLKMRVWIVFLLCLAGHARAAPVSHTCL